MQPDSMADVTKIVIGAAVGSSGALIAFVLTQYIQNHYWKTEIPKFQDFKADFLAYAQTLQTHLGDDWDDRLFTEFAA